MSELPRTHDFTEMNPLRNWRLFGNTPDFMRLEIGGRCPHPIKPGDYFILPKVDGTTTRYRVVGVHEYIDEPGMFLAVVEFAPRDDGRTLH